MTSERQNAAIAEACEIVTHDHWGPLYRTPHGLVRVCPDFTGDLNAMYEAEKVIVERGDEAMLDYDQELSMVTDSWKWNATAAQRARAFLETLGLWEEAKNEA
jgi:hypothetical protein